VRAETHSDELVQEGEDFGSIRVLLGQGDDCTFEDGHNQLSMAGTNGRLDKDRVDRFTERTVEVVVPDVEIVDPLTGEARGDIVPLFFLLEDEGEEALDGRRGDVVAVRALDQGLRSREKGVSWFGSPSSSLQPWLPLPGVVSCVSGVWWSSKRTLPLRSKIATKLHPGMSFARFIRSPQSDFERLCSRALMRR
jgi:hypothetical protein